MKELIEFAKDNWANIPSWYIIEWDFLVWKKFTQEKNSATCEVTKIDILRIIQQKDFIDALAIWIMKKWIDISTDLIIWGWNYEPSSELSETSIIRYKISDAIYNNTLPEFINNLWIWKQ